ncbi:MAG: LmbE family protein [Chloroflexi bacterium]|nr:LmbE family protein [Chloroflexota bacterium]
MTKRAFAVAAHPDDIEFVMAGTLTLLGQAGYEIHYMNIANGSCGTMHHSREEIIRIRRDEARAAAASIGAVFHESLVDDLEIFYDRSLLARVGAVMREVAPEILLLQSPNDYMEDHQNAVRLAVTAAFCRSMPNWPTDPPRRWVSQDVTVYHAQPHGNRDALRQPVHPEMCVDIASVFQAKWDMLTCHQSQKVWLDESQGMDSYLLSMRALSEQIGQISGRFELAEGWRRRSHLGFCSEDADPLLDALSDYAIVLPAAR